MATGFSLELTQQGYRAQLVDLGSVSGNVQINVNQGNEFLINPTGATVIYFTGIPPSGQVGYWSLEIRSPGTNSVTFASGVTFDTGSGVIAGGTRSTVFAFRCRNGSTIVGGTSYANIPG